MLYCSYLLWKIKPVLSSVRCNRAQLISGWENKHAAAAGHSSPTHKRHFIAKDERIKDYWISNYSIYKAWNSKERCDEIWF